MFKVFIRDDLSSNIWSEIMFKGSARVSPKNKFPTIYSTISQMKFLNTVIPLIAVFCGITSWSSLLAKVTGLQY